MLVLAIDTTTRAGSLCLWRDGTELETFVGDAERTHATRLPGDILDCLARHGLTLADVDLYGVAAGPGSFTGLRIGIATIQGLAFANGRQVVGVSTLDALAEAVARTPGQPAGMLGAWVDAQRAEVFAALYGAESGAWTPAFAPVVAPPDRVLDAWDPHLGASPVTMVGDGAVAYAAEIERRLSGRADVLRRVPPLAPAIAVIAARAASAGQAAAPHAVKPIYIRRPDAVLARERRRGAEPGAEKPNPAAESR